MQRTFCELSISGGPLEGSRHAGDAEAPLALLDRSGGRDV